MMKITVLYSSRSEKLINDIIKTENLSVVVERSENAIGDSIINVKGEKEEVQTLLEIYKMVK